MTDDDERRVLNDWGEGGKEVEYRKWKKDKDWRVEVNVERKERSLLEKKRLRKKEGEESADALREKVINKLNTGNGRKVNKRSEFREERRRRKEERVLNNCRRSQ